MSLDNSLMMEIYPFGGFWAYLKFNFIDGITKQSVMLLDKTRVDYDVKNKEDGAVVKQPRDESEFKSMLQRFGLNTATTNEERVKQIRNELNET